MRIFATQRQATYMLGRACAMRWVPTNTSWSAYGLIGNGYSQQIFTGRAPFFEFSNPTATLRIIQGVKPTCPPPGSAPRVQWGLTKPIWRLMMECWAHDSADRPPIGVVANRLVSQSVAPDLRPIQMWGSASISPARFRNAVNKPHYYPSIEDLDFILCT